VEERLASGWRYGEKRDNERKQNPASCRHDELPLEQQGKDRDAVRNIPEIVTKAGYEIVWLRA